MTAFEQMSKREWEEWVAAGEQTLRRQRRLTVKQAEARLERIGLEFDQAVRQLHEAIHREVRR